MKTWDGYGNRGFYALLIRASEVTLTPHAATVLNTDVSMPY